jgi:hypothetical protein
MTSSNDQSGTREIQEQNAKPSENDHTRAGGPDDTRDIHAPEQTPRPSNADPMRAGGPDDTRQVPTPGK